MTYISYIGTYTELDLKDQKVATWSSVLWIFLKHAFCCCNCSHAFRKHLFFFPADTHTRGKVPVVPSTRIHLSRRKYPPKHPICKPRRAEKEGVHVAGNFQHIFHPAAVFERPLGQDSGIYQLNRSCKHYRSYKISDVDISTFFSDFFSGIGLHLHNSSHR